VRWAFVVSILSALALPFVFGQWKALVSLGLMLAIWIVATIVVNLWERVRVTSGQLTTFQKLRTQSRSYYGMQLAHLGVAVFVVGVTIVTGYQSEQDVRMERGDIVRAGGYEFQFNGVANVTGPNYQAARAEIIVNRNGAEFERMYPEKRNYTASGNVMTETAIDSGIFRDLYISLGEPVGNNAWSVRVYYKPFVGWIWGGAVLMALGGGLALSDRRYALAARKEREARETVKASEVPSPVAVHSRSSV
jgi:cytochrome c-type biogenesis protein CcmF